MQKRQVAGEELDGRRKKGRDGLCGEEKKGPLCVVEKKAYSRAWRMAFKHASLPL